MILKIISWVWISWGILFLIWPQLLKRRLAKKGVKKMKRTVLFLSLPLFFWFFLIILRANRLAFRLVIFLFIILIVKAIFYFITKSAYRLKSFIGQRPLKVFRIFAFFYIILGLSFLKFAA